MHENQWNPSIVALHDCAVSCEVCVSDCLKEEDVHALTAVIRASQDCASLCRVTVELMARSSASTKTVCRACAELCARCAELCEAHDRRFAQACAQACWRAREECEAILA